MLASSRAPLAEPLVQHAPGVRFWWGGGSKCCEPIRYAHTLGNVLAFVLCVCACDSGVCVYVRGARALGLLFTGRKKVGKSEALRWRCTPYAKALYPLFSS